MDDDKFRISALASSSNGVVGIHPDKTLKEATSIMLLHDYSQLPVMTSKRNVKGTISWKSIGTSLQLGDGPQLVKECMDSNYTVLKLRDNFLIAVKEILLRDFVLLKDETNKICGICTLADIGSQFLALSEPFIEIEQIEIAIREWIGDKVDKDFLASLNDNSDSARTVSKISDLTFGEYIRWFEDEINWTSLDVKIDKKIFVERLINVNQIRNRLMHFRHDDNNKNDIVDLRNVSQFLRKSRKLRRSR